MNNTRNVSGKRFLAMIVLVHIAFFLLACLYRRVYMGDSFEYIYEALNIKDAFFFYSGNPALPIQPEFMTQRQPLYPMFLMLVYIFTVNNWIVLVLQNMLSVFNIWYLRKSLFIMGYKPKYDRYLFILVLAYPIQFIYASTIAPEILLQTFVLIYIRQMILMVMHRNGSHAAWASFALIAGLFVKPVLYPFVVVHLLLLLLCAVRNKLSIARNFGIGMLPLLAVLMYSSWNFERTGKFHFSSNQAFNAIFYYFTYVAATEGVPQGRKFVDGERAKLAAIPKYKDRYDSANARGISLLKQNFFPYMAFHLKHSARLFIEPGKAEIDLFTGKLTYGGLYSKQGEGFFATIKSKGVGGLADYVKRNPSLPIALLVLLFNVLRLIGVVMFLFSRKVLLPVRLFLLVMFGYFAVTTGPITNTHYFLPISLVAMGCAVIGYMNWRERNSKLATVTE